MILSKYIFSREKSKLVMQDWIEKKALSKMDPFEQKLRDDLFSRYKAVTEKLNGLSIKSDYCIDYKFGIELFKYFSSQEWFNLRLAANDGFWRFLSLKILPDIVTERWGADNEDHFWRKPSRIWLRVIWKYIYLSYQGSIEETEELLKSKNFSTDTILNLVERTGRKGTYVQVYRYNMYFYSKLDLSVISEYKNAHQNADLFRAIMVLNTAKVVSIEPSLFLGGELEYAKSLFKKWLKD